MNKHLSKGKIVKHGYWVKSHYVSRSNTGYWSKYGGGKLVEHAQLPEWKCQSCGEMQFNVLPSYLYEYPQGEYIKICTMCRYMVIRYSLETFTDLLSVVRGTGVFDTIANLLTLPLRYPHD